MNRQTVALFCAVMLLWPCNAISSDPEGPEALLASGTSLVRGARYDEAIEALSKAVTLFQPNDPAQQSVRLARAEAYYRKGDVEQALDDAAYATKLDTTDERAKAWSLMLRGLLSMRETSHNDALRFLTDAIKTHHDDLKLRAECFMNRGRAFINLARAEEAISDLSKSLELEPDLNQAKQLRKQAFLLKEEVGQARRDSRDALTGNRGGGTGSAPRHASRPEPPSTTHSSPVGRTASELTNNGLRFYSQGDYAQAIEHYTAALGLLNPADRFVPRVKLFRALAYVGKGDRQNAWDDAGSVIQSGQGDYQSVVNAHFIRGSIATRKRSFDLALQEYTQATQTPHQDKKLRSRSFTERGRMFMEFSQHEQAVRDLDNALKWDPDSAYAYWSRCDAHMEQGEMGKARSDCEQAVAKGLSGRLGQQARDILNELSAGPTGPRTVKVPMDRNGTIHVQIRFSEHGRPFRFLLDTGASGCLVDSAALDRIRKETSVVQSGKGVSVIADGTRLSTTFYQVGTAFLYNLPLGPTDVGVSEKKAGRIENLFGTRAMKNLSVKIDNVKREAEITLLK